jgi:hypothetical protein
MVDDNGSQQVRKVRVEHDDSPGVDLEQRNGAVMMFAGKYTDACTETTKEYFRCRKESSRQQVLL